MLTLTNPLVIEGFTVYHDDANDIEALQAHIDAELQRERDRIGAIDGDLTGRSPGPSRAPGRTPPDGPKHFHVLPGQPALALDETGKPIFSLVVYRRDDARIDPDKAPKEDVGGGILTFTVELGVPEEKLRRIRARLRAIVYGEDVDDASQDVEVSLVEFLDGKVSVAVAGEGTADAGDAREFVKSAVGTGKVSGIGNNRKAVMVKLTQDGAALMSQIDRLRTLPINVQYELTFEHRLLGVSMRVWCDVSSSYHLLQTASDAKVGETGGYLGTGWGSDDIMAHKLDHVTEVIVRNKTAGVVVVPYSSLVDNDTLLSLEKMGQDMLSKEMEKVVEAKPPPADLDRTYLEQYFSDVSNQLNFTLDRRMVLARSYNPSANISNVFQRSDLDELVAFVDLRTAFFSLLKVPIRVNADFAKLPISSVVVTVSYESRRPDGVREERVESFDFADGSTIQTFLAFANSLDDVAYDWKATVHYKDSQEPYVFSKHGAKETFLVVDVGTLGLIAVDIGIGLVDLDKFPAATVSIRYVSRALGHGVEQSFLLNKEKQSVLWTDVIREESSGSYEYKVDWLRKEDGSILEGQWTKSTSVRLRVDAPIPDRLTVSAVCTGNFKDERDQITHVVVSLRYSDPDNGYVQEGRLDFTDDKQMLPWTVDLRNPALRDYEYRYSILYKGGVVRNVPEDGTSWLPGPPGFVVVGEKYGLEVNLYPYLLQYGDREKVVQVDMRYADPERRITANDSFVFSKETSKPQVWRVRTDPAGPKTYSVDITYFGTTGGAIRLPTRDGDSDALLIPPAPPPQP